MGLGENESLKWPNNTFITLANINPQTTCSFSETDHKLACGTKWNRLSLSTQKFKCQLITEIFCWVKSIVLSKLSNYCRYQIYYYLYFMDGRMARPGSTWCLLWVQIWWQEWHKSAQTLQSPVEAECSATDGGQVKGECDEWETSVCKKRSLSSLQCNASTEKYWIERNHTTYNRALDSSRRTPCIVRPWNAASDHQLWIWAGEDPWTCLEAFNLQLKLQEHKLDFLALCQPNQSTESSNPTNAVDLSAHELEKEWNGVACCQPLESSGSRWDTSTPSADATVHKRFFFKLQPFKTRTLWLCG